MTASLPRRLPLWHRLAGALALLALAVMALPFAGYSAWFGATGLAGGPVRESHIITPGGLAANAAVFAHMLGGALATGLAPLQLVGPLRRRWPAVHRWSGRLLVAGALAAGVGGLVHIALRGTIGGWPMDLGFAAYGLCLMVAAVQAMRFARAGEVARHRDWALRLFVLAIGSFLFRLQYGLWKLATGGIGREEDFSGWFDRVMVVGFWLPWLLLVEVLIRRRRRG